MNLKNGYEGMVPRAHGGYCCGITHIQTFPALRATANERLAWLNNAVNEAIDSQYKSAVLMRYVPKGMRSITREPVEGCGCSDCRDAAKRAAENSGPTQKEINKAYAEGRKQWVSAIEIVLNNFQVDEWRETVEARGFKEVFSFHNDNSGNTCYVFYLQTGPA